MNRDTILIEADELLTKIADPTIRILDATILFYNSEEEAANEPTAHEEYLEGHIPGAAFFDHQKFSDASSDYQYTLLPEMDLATQIGSIGIDVNSEVVLYSTGMLLSATRAWWILRYAGLNNVRVLNGGLTAWEKAGGDVEEAPHQYEAATFECALRTDMFASKEDVKAAIEDDAVYLVNTLSPESFEEAHIVDSANLPCGDLMRGWAYFLPNDELAAILKDESPHERIIVYCGGGISATVNAMAHLMVGNENVSVYDGSMTEWMWERLPTAKGTPK